MKNALRNIFFIVCAVPMIGAAQLPSGLGDAAHPPQQTILSGLYSSEDVGSCCWMGQTALIRAYPPAGAKTLVVVFSVPDYGPFRHRSEGLTLRIAGQAPQVRCCYGIGQHAVVFPLPSRGEIDLHFAASLWFVPKDIGLNQDTRKLSVMIRSFDYRSDSGLLLLSSGSAIDQSIPMTPVMLGLFVLTFLISVMLAWRCPIYAIVLLILLEPFGSSVSIGLTTVSFFKIALVGTLIGFWPHAPWRDLRERREALVPLACIAALVVAAIVSVIHAVYPVLVFREVFKYLEYAIVFSVSFFAYRITRDRGVAGVAFALVALAVCAVALLQERTGTPQTAYVLGHIVPRIAGPLEGPNQLAGWLEIVIPVLLGVRLQKGLRSLGTVAVIVAIVTSMATLSRAGMLGLVTGIAVFAMASQRAEGRRVAPFALAAGFAAIVIFAYRALPAGPASDAFNNGLGTRSQLWHAAVVLWRSHPFTGIGAGNFETQLGSLGLVGIRTHANSWYLQSLAEGGILMFGAVLATIYGLILTLISSRAVLTTAALAATIAISVHQIFDDLIFFPKVGAMWWLIVGVGAAALSVIRTESVPPPQTSENVLL